MDDKTKRHDMTKELIPRKTIVVVEKNSRARFPGKTSEVGDRGIVWSKWYSKGWGTEKISILKSDLTVSFTSASCVSIDENKQAEDDFNDIHVRWAEENYLPIIVQIVDVRLSQPNIQQPFDQDRPNPGAVNIQKAKTVKCKTLMSKELYLKKSYCHPFDWETMIEGIFENKKVFSIRVEPWILEKNNII
mgnify:CR=1 FL=1